MFEQYIGSPENSDTDNDAELRKVSSVALGTIIHVIALIFLVRGTMAERRLSLIQL